MERSLLAENASEALKLDAEQLLSFGIVDEIITEPIGGAHADWDQTAESIKMHLIKFVEKMEKELIEEKRRYSIQRNGIFYLRF